MKAEYLPPIVTASQRASWHLTAPSIWCFNGVSPSQTPAVSALRTLLDQPRWLDAYLLYDEKGSELFERICQLPEYYLTRTEDSILARHAADVIGATPVECIVELGAGSAKKTVHLLHEQMRSYRFFSQMAAQLAGAGIACLRFDYYGTGDSGGDDGQFQPDSTARDLVLAAAELRRLAPGIPLVVMAARASALFAWRDAGALGASALWLWQPVVDGARYVQSLLARDARERGSKHRYPLLKGRAPALRDDLMGFRLSPGAQQALAALTLAGPGPEVPVSVVDTADGEGHALESDARFRLPASLSAWTDEIDLDGLIPLRDARDALEGLLAGLAKGGARG